MKLLAAVAALAVLAGCASGGSNKAFGAFARGFVGTTEAIQNDQATRDAERAAAAERASVVPASQLSPAPQPSVTATLTGTPMAVTTVSGVPAWQCAYNYGGQVFMLVFENQCPTTVMAR